MNKRLYDEPYELSHEEMKLGFTLNSVDNTKAIIGPLFCIGGAFGLINGVLKSLKAIPLNISPKRLMLTSFVNITSTEVFKYANSAGGFGFVYCFTKKVLNFIFEEEIKKISNIKRQTLYGFAAGMVFKSTRGLGPSILSGFLVGNYCFGLAYLIEKKQLNYHH